MKLTGYQKRYVIVFVVGLVITNAYAFWPAFAYSSYVFSCPAIFGPVWFEVTGAAQVVGPPLYSEMQMVMHPGSSAYEKEVFESQYSNLTQLFQYDQPSRGSVTQYLWQINGLTGQQYQDQVAANQTGVTISFQNITFQGIHIAKIVSKIDVSNSAIASSYELAEPPCRPGLVLTVGSLPYAGPLEYSSVQLMTVIISNAVGLMGSTVSCIGLTFYWNRPKTSPNTMNNVTPSQIEGPEPRP